MSEKKNKILQKIMGLKGKATAFINDLSDKNAKDYLTKKHDKRIEFYNLLIDFMRSPGESNPLRFFDWYLNALNDRMKKEPEPLRVWRKLSGSKNQSTIRHILEQCKKRVETESDFNKVIKPYLPNDEYRIIASAAKADITSEIEAATEIAIDKQTASKIKWDAVKSNVPVIIIAGLIHYVLYTEIYDPAVIPNFHEKTSYSEMSLTEKGYYHYYIFITYWYLFLAAAVGLTSYIIWLTKNWCKHGIHLRENYFNYIPPFSIVRLSEQYSLILIVSSSMRAGKNFYTALEEAREDATQYMKLQVGRILERSNLPAHEAMDTDFMGEFGSMIKDRGQHVQIDVAMISLLEKIRKIKNERLATTVNVSVKMTLRPLAILSVVAGLAPYIIDTINAISEISDKV